MKNINVLINDLIEAYLRDGVLNKYTPVALSVIYKDNIYRHLNGVNKNSSKDPVNERTLFPVASITKSFTAMSILFLLKEKALSLDSPINSDKQYIQSSDSEVNLNLTYKDVLTHISGLPANDFLWYFSDFSLSQLLTTLKNQELIPNTYKTKFHYNNLIYTAFEPIIEDLSNKTFSNFMNYNLFKPLGMKGSRLVDEDSFSIFNNSAFDSSDLILKKLIAIRGASGIISNLEDLTEYLMAQLKPQDSSFQDIIKNLHKRNVDIVDANPIIFNGLEWIKNPGYGMGWFNGEFHGSKIVYVMGIIDNFTSLIAFLPEYELGAVVLTNLNLSPFPGQMVKEVFSSILGYKTTQITKSIPIKDKEKLFSPGTNVKLNIPFEGKYKDTLYGEITLCTAGDKYFIEYCENKWEVFFISKSEGFFYVEFSKTKLKMAVHIFIDQHELRSVNIPFSFDPRLPIRKFIRLE